MRKRPPNGAPLGQGRKGAEPAPGDPPAAPLAKNEAQGAAVETVSSGGDAAPSREARLTREIVDALYPAGVDLVEVVRSVVEQVLMRSIFDAACEGYEPRDPEWKTRRAEVEIPPKVWTQARTLVLEAVRAWEVHVTAAIGRQKDSMVHRLLTDGGKLRVASDYDGAHRAERQLSKLLGLDAPKKSAFVGAVVTGKFGDQKLKEMGFDSEEQAVRELEGDADVLASLTDDEVAELVAIGRAAEKRAR